MKPERLEHTSVDGSKLNLEALYQIAPSCFTEEKDEKTGTVKHVVNFKTLRQLLGDDAVDNGEEMYQFTWPGKQAARREAATPITDTLRPVPEDSVDWDTTQNLYIEGDNLRVLKLLQKGYMGKVKMIYIDPPYNTGNDFVYHDDFAVDNEQYVVDKGDRDTEGYRYRKNLDSNGRFHSDWCSMMYSRLLVARSLLTEDGVIFISIDDNEVHNLRKICDEVLGERNFVGNIIWQSRTSISNDDFISTNHNHTLIYAKNLQNINFGGDDIDAVDYINNDNDPRGPWKLVPIDANHVGGNTVYAIRNPKTGVDYYPPNGRIWCYNQDKMNEFIKDGRIKFGLTDDSSPKRKLYYRERIEKGDVKTPSSILLDAGSTKTGTSEIMQMFQGKKVFDYPKPTTFLCRMIKYGAIHPDSLILDFFSGSATTAHAVMQLNAEDGGKRKYIMVQYDEDTPEQSEARKAGYKTIPEIAKERIRRAGKKIKEESPLSTQHLDTGFRVFRLSGSNYEDVTKQPGEYDQQMLDLFADNIKADRTDLDLLFGAMLSWGVQLSMPMTTEEVDGCNIYTVDGNGLVACFAENITENVVKAMADKQPLRVLFRDSCFSEDKTKINIFELFKQQLDWDENEAIQNIRVI